MSIKPTINYPVSLDTATTYNGTDKVAVVEHAEMHTGLEQAVVALETKVGVDSSAVTTTHDFKLSGIPAADKSASLTGTETLTGKTLTTPIISSIKPSGGNTQTVPDATSTLSDISSAQTMTNKTLTSPVLDGSLSGTAFKDEDNMVSNSATSVASQQSIKAYVDNAVSSGVPDTFGGIVVNSSSVSYTDEFFRVNTQSGTTFRIASPTTEGFMNNIDTDSTTWTDADVVGSSIILGGNMYTFLEDTNTAPDTYRIYRYDLTDITAAGTLMTFSGVTVLDQTDDTMRMTSDGTNFYIDFEAGNSANSYEIAKYTLSGTVLTYDSTITLSDAIAFNQGFVVDISGNIYTMTSGTLKKYNSSGTLQYTSTATAFDGLLNFSNSIYGIESGTNMYMKAFL